MLLALLQLHSISGLSARYLAYEPPSFISYTIYIYIYIYRFDRFFRRIHVPHVHTVVKFHFLKMKEFHCQIPFVEDVRFAYKYADIPM